MSAALQLFALAHNAEQVAKAVTSRAHEVIIDLEDGVSPAEKSAARAALALLKVDRPCFVRINGGFFPSTTARLIVTSAMSSRRLAPAWSAATAILKGLTPYPELS